MSPKKKQKKEPEKRGGKPFLVQCTICSAVESVQIENLDPYSFPLCDEDGAIMVLVGLQNEPW